jgi:hypothetical protein
LAVALGLDVSCRIALGSTVDRGWHRTAAMSGRESRPPGVIISLRISEPLVVKI